MLCVVVTSCYIHCILLLLWCSVSLNFMGLLPFFKCRFKILRKMICWMMTEVQSVVSYFGITTTDKINFCYWRRIGITCDNAYCLTRFWNRCDQFSEEVTDRHVLIYYRFKLFAWFSEKLFCFSFRWWCDSIELRACYLGVRWWVV